MSKVKKAAVDKLMFYLTDELDLESEKRAEEINTDKIKRILALMDRCVPMECTADIHSFACIFNHKYDQRLRVRRIRSRRGGIGRGIAGILIILSLIFTSEVIAVNAFDFSVISYLKETVNKIIYKIQYGQEVHYKSPAVKEYAYVESLLEQMPDSIYLPGPVELEFEHMMFNEFSDSAILSYRTDERYFYWEWMLPVGSGAVDYNMDQFTLVEEGLMIGEKCVNLYTVEVEGETSHIATFLHQDILHVAETNLSPEKLKKVIKEAEIYEK